MDINISLCIELQSIKIIGSYGGTDIGKLFSISLFLWILHWFIFNNNNNNTIINIIIINLFTAIALSPGGSGYFASIQNMKSVTNNLSPEGYMRSM